MSAPSVFISYSSRDRDVARNLTAALEAQTFAVWRDETRLETDWSREIAQALADSDIYCLLWSRAAAASRWVRLEYLTAWALESPIVVCRLRDAPPLPQPLVNLQWFPIQEGASPFASLISAVQRANETPVARDYSPVPDRFVAPFPPDPNFLGRRLDLLDLYLKVIGSLNKLGRARAGLIGMGGVGKTALVAEFIRRFAFAFDEAYWLDGADPHTLASQLAAIARDYLHLELASDSPRDDLAYVTALEARFAAQHVLLVVDNVANPLVLNATGYISDVHQPVRALLGLPCDLIFTTRNHADLPAVDWQTMNELSVDDGRRLLTLRRHPATAEEARAVDAICALVGNLPLALVLIGAFLVRRNSVSFGSYLQELEQRRLTVLDASRVPAEQLATRHEASVSAAFAQQWALIDDNARRLLQVAACCPEGIPIPRARLELGVLPPPTSALDTPFDDAFNDLQDLTLLKAATADRCSIHPLIAEFVRATLTDAARTMLLSETATGLVDRYLNPSQTLDSQCASRGVRDVLSDFAVAKEWAPAGSDDRITLELLHRLTTAAISDVTDAHVSARLGQQLHLRAFRAGEAAFATKLASGLSGPVMRGRSTSARDDRTLLRRFTWDAGQITAVDLNLSGTMVVSGSQTGRVGIWTTERPGPLRDVKLADPIRAVSFSRDAEIAYVATSTGIARWSLRSGELGDPIAIEGSRGIELCGERHLAVIAGRTRLSGWDLQKREEYSSIASGVDAPIVAMRASADARFAVTVHLDGTVGWWDIDRGQFQIGIQSRSRVTGIALAEDGAHVALTCADKTAYVVDLRAHKTVLQFFIPQAPNIQLAMQWDARVLVIADGLGSDGEIQRLDTEAQENVMFDFGDRLPNLSSGPITGRLRLGNPAPVSRVAMSEDGRYAATGCTDGSVSLWDLSVMSRASAMSDNASRIHHSRAVFAVALRTDDQDAASLGHDRSLIVWPVERKGRIEVQDFPPVFPAAAAFRDTGIVVFSGADGAMTYFFSKAWREQAHDSGVGAVALSANALWGASADLGDTPHVLCWDCRQERRTTRLGPFAAPIGALAISDDGRTVAVGLAGGTVIALDTRTKRELFRFAAHPGEVRALAMDGRAAHLATAGDHSIAVWQTESQRRLAMIVVDSQINGLAFNGRVLAAGDVAGDVTVFNVQLTTPLQPPNR